MSYCTRADIVADFGNKVAFSATSKVTDTDVDSYIDSESNYIDSYLASKYVVPVVQADSPLAFDILKRVCIFKVSLRIKNILDVKNGSNQTEQDVKGVRNPDKDLELIRKGVIKLLDATLATTSDGISFGTRCSKQLTKTFEW